MSLRPEPKKYKSKDEILEDLKGGKDYIYIIDDIIMGGNLNCSDNCLFRKECELFSEQGRDYSCKGVINAAILSMRDNIKENAEKQDYLIDNNIIIRLNQTQWGIINFLAHKLHFAAAPYKQPERYTEEDFAPFAATQDLSHTIEKDSFDS